MTPGIDDSFEELVELMMRTPRPLALLGAGASVDSGYPTWETLLARLYKHAASKLSPKYATYLEKLKDDPAWQAEELRRVLTPAVFDELIKQEFSPKQDLGPLIRMVARLGFRHVLTTNYDNCAERALQAANVDLTVIDWAAPSSQGDFIRNLSRNDGRTRVVYLHGTYNDAANVILTESSYVKRYLLSDDARQKLFAILITQPVVFIGFSVNDPDLNYIMREVNAKLGDGNPQHFAIVGYEVDDQRVLFANRFRGKYGIAPVFYRISDKGGHEELLALLTRLYARVHGRPYAVEFQRAAPPAPPPAREARRAIDPLDPHKGQFGGHTVHGGRQVRLARIRIDEKTELATFDIVVEQTESAATPLTGDVVFHLHPTFHQAKYRVIASGGKAVLEDVTAYGAFTIGVEADGGATRLELDIVNVPDFPQWFKDR